MRKYILIFCLILGFFNQSEVSAENGEVLVASKAKLSSQKPYYKAPYAPFYGRYNNPYYRGYKNPFIRRNYGTLTGYTPPLNGTYYSTGYPPYTYTTGGIGNRIKRVFNPNYYNVCKNNPSFAPYTNNNTNILNNGRYIPLFRGTSNGGLNGNNFGNGYNGQNLNGLFNDGLGTSESGATVTIID